jgi:hypothetical protein
VAGSGGDLDLSGPGHELPGSTLSTADRAKGRRRIRS